MKVALISVWTAIVLCLSVSGTKAQISPGMLSGVAGNTDTEIRTDEFEVNRPYAGDMTLLSSACLNGNDEKIIDDLLTKGGNPNFKTYQGITPLMYAAANRYGNPYCLKRFLRLGIAPNGTDNRRRTALMIAAGQKNPEFVRLLLSYGANVHARDSRGGTALFYAVKFNDNTEVTKLLLAAGASVFLRGNHNNLILNEAAGSNPNPEIIDLLLRYGADINAGNSDYATPLIFAARLNPNPEVVDLLLRRGANAKIRTRFGYKAIDFAALNPVLRNSEVYKKLEKASK